jgi:NADPH-dependent glutamate synthase beta subunit-like oxidoreductase
VRIGRDLEWFEISERYAAVFVATGAHIGRRATDDAPGVLQGLEFLSRVNAGEAVAIGARVVVIGGGNTAIDCARTALRLGSAVTVIYRRTREEMPAIREEVEEAEREGVAFLFLAAPERHEVTDGVLRAVVCTPMSLGEPDESGRRRPIASGEPPVRVEADTVITAIGEDVELGILPDAIAGHSMIPVDEWGTTKLKVVFAGGDAAGDERTVAHALGAGKRGAIGIDRYLRIQRGEDCQPETPRTLQPAHRGTPSMARWEGSDPVRRTAPIEEIAGPDAINHAHFVPVPRATEQHLPPPLATMNFAEANLGLTADEALAEASRCFNCGVCNGCELCMIYCADVAIHRVEGDEGRFAISLEHCKGCGVCAEECPRGAIAMIREEP